MSAPFRTEARFILVLDQLPTKSDFYMCIHFRHGTSKIIHHYCRASHTGDAGRGRGRERERGMSSELANMTC